MSGLFTWNRLHFIFFDMYLYTCFGENGGSNGCISLNYNDRIDKFLLRIDVGQLIMPGVCCYHHLRKRNQHPYSITQL